MSIFSQLLPYLTDPLIIMGLVFFLLFYLLRYLLAQGVVKTLPAKLNGERSRLVLSHSYLLGLLLFGLGIYWQHSELREAEEQQALQLLGGEFQQNSATLDAFQSNVGQAIVIHEQVSQALRSGQSQILQLIFPVANTQPDSNLNVTNSVESSFQKLKVSGWLKNQNSMALFNQDKARIQPEIEDLSSRLKALMVSEDQRFVIDKAVWGHHMDVYRDMEGFDLSGYEDGLILMEELRDDYMSVLNQSDEFLMVVNDFMARSTFLGNRDVYEILSQERHSYQLLTIYAAELSAQQQALQAVAQQLQPSQ